MDSDSRRRSKRALAAAAAVAIVLLALLWLAWRPRGSGVAAARAAPEASEPERRDAGGPQIPEAAPASESEAPPPLAPVSEPLRPKAAPTNASPRPARDAREEHDTEPEIDVSCGRTHVAWLLRLRLQNLRGVPKSVPLSMAMTMYVEGGGSMCIACAGNGVVEFEHSQRSPGPFPDADGWVRVVDLSNEVAYSRSFTSPLVGRSYRLAARAPKSTSIELQSTDPRGSLPECLDVRSLSRFCAPVARDGSTLPGASAATLEDPFSFLGFCAESDGGALREPLGLIELLARVAPSKDFGDGTPTMINGLAWSYPKRWASPPAEFPLSFSAHRRDELVSEAAGAQARPPQPALVLSAHRSWELDGRGAMTFSATPPCTLASVFLTCLVTEVFTATVQMPDPAERPATVEGELRGVLYLMRCCEECATGPGCVSAGKDFEFYEPGRPPPDW